MNILKKLNLFLVALVLCFTPSLASANLSVAPYNADRANPQNKDWFIFSAKAGENFPDALILNNSDKDDYQVNVLGKDFEVTDDGSFTIIADGEENKEAGNWLKLDANEVTVPAKKNIKLPFKVEIPKNTQDGEYAAGFGVSLAKQSEEALNITIRKGVRSYIAVGEDFKLGTKIANLNILDPKDADYNKVKTQKQYFGKDNLILDFEAENSGNVFGILDCKYALNYADGGIYEGIFTTDLAPRVGKRNYSIVTNEPYKSGKTQAILDCEIKPQNIETKSVKLENQKAVISDNLELSKEELDYFEESKQPAFNKPKQNQAQSTDQTPTQQNSEITQENQKNNWWLYVGIFGIIICILVVVGLYMKRKNMFLPKPKQ